MSAHAITSLAELHSIRDQWNLLAAQSASPLLDHEWLVTCAEHLHDESDLRVTVVRDRGVITGAAPLVRESGGSTSHLVLLGASRLYEPGGWLFTSLASLAELTAALIQQRMPVLLHRIPAASLLATTLPDVIGRRAVMAVRAGSQSFSVSTRSTWNDFCSRLSRRTIAGLGKSLLSAERMLGSSLVEDLEPKPADVGRLLEDFSELEGSGWKQRNGSSMQQRTDLAAFFRAYCIRMAKRGQLRMARLSFGSVLAAAEISVDAYGRRWGLKLGYREELARYSPGLQLIHASIRAAVERGLESYEFLGVAEPWQHRWRPEPRDYRLLAIYPWSAQGMIAGCHDLISSLWRRAFSATKPSAALRI